MSTLKIGDLVLTKNGKKGNIIYAPPFPHNTEGYYNVLIEHEVETWSLKGLTKLENKSNLKTGDEIWVQAMVTPRDGKNFDAYGNIFFTYLTTTDGINSRVDPDKVLTKDQVFIKDDSKVSKGDKVLVSATACGEIDKDGDIEVEMLDNDSDLCQSYVRASQIFKIK